MNKDTKEFDVIVIGGGAAGMMAALSAKHHHPEYTVAILDQTFELGRKVLTSGAGRGNITNSQLAKNPEDYYHGDKSCIASVFSQFGYEDILHFFDVLGIPWYEEKKSERGKIFPVIDHAKTFRNMLVDAILEKNITVFYNTRVTTIEKDVARWIIHTQDSIIYGTRVIISGGGKTYPALGSDGSLYAIAETLGHTIVPPVVSAVPLVSKNQMSHFLQGEKCRMEVTSIIGEKDISTVVGEVMFTQYGFSGPAIFDISRDVSIRINREKKRDVFVRFSFFPKKSYKEVEQIIKDRFRNHPAYPISHCLWGLFTDKVAGGICAVAQLPKDLIAQDITPEAWKKLINILTSYTVEISDTRGWNEGEFTAGGVSTKEVHEKTLESKKQKGLYFAGEILDVDGPVGGFNLSWSWASGWVAGKVQ
jgi:predicted Rossmann fold flavoprotein